MGPEPKTGPLPGAASRPDVIDRIADVRQVYVRFALTGSQCLMLEATGAHPPPKWTPGNWTYPGTIFVAKEMSGQELASWLQVGTIAVGVTKYALPTLLDHTIWERRQSNAPTLFETLDWPATEAVLARSAGLGEPQGHLLSEGDAPSFLDFPTAAASFFCLGRQPGPGSISGGIQYRHQDVRARFNRIRTSASEVVVIVEGEDLNLLTVELASDAPGQREVIWESYQNRRRMTKTVTFPLSEGLPPGTWAVLRRGSEWIDRRFLSVAWGRGIEPGVEVAVEATTRLESLVSARERQQVEFKRQLPNDDTKPKLMKTVCAFANGDGGSILIGVDDDRNLVGVDPGSVDRLGDQLTQTIGSWVAPRPPIDFNVLPIPDSDKVVLELIVKPGTEPYASGRAGETRTAYVRYHGVTEKAHPAEIIAIVRTRTPGNPTLGWQPGS